MNNFQLSGFNKGVQSYEKLVLTVATVIDYSVYTNKKKKKENERMKGERLR